MPRIGGDTIVSDYAEIANQPTKLTKKYIEGADSYGCKGWHESLLRSWHIVRKLRWLLELKTDHEVILELLDLMESDAFQPNGYFEARAKEESEPGKVQGVGA